MELNLIYKSIANRLQELREEDQQNIRLEHPDPEVNKKHLEELKNFLSQVTFIDITRFGWLAAHSAWLIVQHANHDVEFQEGYLKLMEANLDEVIVEDYARLIDRIKINKGLPQVYGTQFNPETLNTDYTPFPIDDEENLDKRRKDLGLCGFAEYKQIMLEKYGLK